MHELICQYNHKYENSILRTYEDKTKQTLRVAANISAECLYHGL